MFFNKYYRRDYLEHQSSLHTQSAYYDRIMVILTRHTATVLIYNKKTVNRQI